MFGNVGFVFDFERTANETISPLRYYPVDGYSNARKESGCGDIGVQWSPTPFNPQGYTMHGSDKSASLDKLYGDEKSYTKAAMDHPTFINTILQPSLNFKQFVDLSLHAMSNVEGSERMGHNEVIVQNWVNIKFDAVPLSAFYFLGETKRVEKAAAHIYRLTQTGRHVPVSAPIRALSTTVQLSFCIEDTVFAINQCKCDNRREDKQETIQCIE